MARPQLDGAVRAGYTAPNDSYFTASQDVLGLEPVFDAFNPRWPVYTAKYDGPVAKVIDGEIRNSLFAAGTVINGLLT